MLADLTKPFLRTGATGPIDGLEATPTALSLGKSWRTAKVAGMVQLGSPNPDEDVQAIIPISGSRMMTARVAVEAVVVERREENEKELREPAVGALADLAIPHRRTTSISAPEDTMHKYGVGGSYIADVVKKGIGREHRRPEKYSDGYPSFQKSRTAAK